MLLMCLFALNISMWDEYVNSPVEIQTDMFRFNKKKKKKSTYFCM